MTAQRRFRIAVPTVSWACCLAVVLGCAEQQSFDSASFLRQQYAEQVGEVQWISSPKPGGPIQRHSMETVISGLEAAAQ